VSCTGAGAAVAAGGTEGADAADGPAGALGAAFFWVIATGTVLWVLGSRPQATVTVAPHERQGQALPKPRASREKLVPQLQATVYCGRSWDLLGMASSRILPTSLP
jgi:hypothetical protein